MKPRSAGMFLGAAVVAVLSVAGCNERFPLFDSQGRLVERNLLFRVNDKYRRISIAVSDNKVGMAYQYLGELAVLVKMVPPESGGARKRVVEDVLKLVEKARAALRLGDVFAARSAVRKLAAPIKMLNAVLAYQGPPKGKSATSAPEAETPAGSGRGGGSK